MTPPLLNISISGCLLGEHVRYDGGHKYQPKLISALKKHAHLYSFCPEVNAKLGVPRPAVQLITVGDSIKARGKRDTTLDVTAALTSAGTEWGRRVTALKLEGVISKAKSPSCGNGSTPLKGQGITTDGLAISALKKQQLPIVLIEDTALLTNLSCKRFVTACHLAREFRRCGRLLKATLLEANLPIYLANHTHWPSLFEQHLKPWISAEPT